MTDTTVAQVPQINDVNNPPAGYNKLFDIDGEAKLAFFTYEAFLVIAISKLTHEEKDGIAMRVYPIEFLPWFAQVVSTELQRQPTAEELEKKISTVAETTLSGEDICIKRAYNLFGKGVYGFVIINNSRLDQMKTDGEQEMITFPEAMLKDLNILAMMGI